MNFDLVEGGLLIELFNLFVRLGNLAIRVLGS